MAVELPSSEADVQALLESAVLSRASHIRRESQTITMANVRRLLESDLGLENSALDIHKALIRQLVDEVLLSSDNVEAPEGEEQKAVSEVPKKTSGSKRLKKGSGKKAREENGSVEDFQDLQEEGVHGEAPKKKQQEKKRRISSKQEDEDGGGSNTNMSEEEAPKKKQQKERKEKEISQSKEVGGGSNADMSEEEVHVEAPKKQQQKERKEKERSHSKEVGGGSRADMSEEEVHVEAPKKKQQKERKEKEISHSKEVGGGSNADLSEEEVHIEAPKKHQQKERKEKERSHIKDGGGSSADMSEEEVHVDSPKKKQQQERKEREISDSKEVGGGSNGDMSEEEVHVEAPKKKQQKERKEKGRSHSKEVDEENESHAVSEEDSDVSEVKKVKKVSPKIASVKPTQNKKIEHLKKIMKACGLTIPPQIYKRAKQQPDDEQDEFLIEEIEKILSRRGLSSNPSDKEIKAAKQKIAREKDLEGIDTTNIILEPRGRRATSQLFAPVYNPPPVEFDSEGDDEEESEDGAESSEGSEDEGKDFAVAEDPEDSD